MRKIRHIHTIVRVNRMEALKVSLALRTATAFREQTASPHFQVPHSVSVLLLRIVSIP